MVFMVACEEETDLQMMMKDLFGILGVRPCFAYSETALFDELQKQSLSPDRREAVSGVMRACAPAVFGVRNSLELFGPETSGLGHTHCP